MSILEGDIAVVFSTSLVVSLIIVSLLLSRKIRASIHTASKPWVHSSRFGWLLTIFDTLERMSAEYQKSCSFSLSTIYGPSRFLPLSQAKLLDVQTNDIFDVDQTHFDLLASDYTFLSSKIRQPGVHQNAIRIALKPGSTMDRWIPCMSEEIRSAFNDALQQHATDSPNPKDANTAFVYPVLYDAVMRASNRVVGGSKLGRNKGFLKNVRRYMSLVPVGAVIINSCPHWLRPIVGRLVQIPNLLVFRQCSRYSTPIIEPKLERALRSQKNGRARCVADLDDGMLQTLADEAVASRDAVEMSAQALAKRLLVLNFASIFPSFAVLWNTVLGLATYSTQGDFIAGIREEIERVKVDESAPWTSKELDQLWRLDSAIKEAMRTWSPLAWGMIRTVSSPSGYTLPDGVHLARGTTIALPMHSIHHDPKFYPNPGEYDAFRFSKLREEPERERDHALTSTARAEYMAFGSGVHACPGRHFASTMIKLILIHLLQHYDIERLDARPPNRCMGAVILPPKEVDIGITPRG